MRIILFLMLSSVISSIEKNSLIWPVKFKSNKDSIANTINQPNIAGWHYFHGGTDLLTTTENWVVSPVKGIVKIGSYIIVHSKDGQYKTHWKNHKNPLYFRIQITTQDGYVFQLHHINKKTQVVRNNQYVNIGDKLGKVITWRNRNYTHVHYNIFSPDGERLNAMYYSKKIDDNIPPVINKIYRDFKYLYINTYDKIGNNIVTPSLVCVNTACYDFRRILKNNINISDIYFKEKTDFNTYVFKFNMRKEFMNYKIRIEDNEGNYIIK